MHVVGHGDADVRCRRANVVTHDADFARSYVAHDEHQLRNLTCEHGGVDAGDISSGAHNAEARGAQLDAMLGRGLLQRKDAHPGGQSIARSELDPGGDKTASQLCVTIDV